MPAPCDALLIVSFGGPEGPDDVIPFLENVLRGKNVPRERMLEVAEHYYHFGGKSPINDQNRALIEKLRALFAAEGPDIPIYWGNRNWRPYLADTVRQMKADGVSRAAAFITSAFGSYSGCRQYLEDIERARQEVGAGAPEIYRTAFTYNRPGFLGPMVENVRAAAAEVSRGAALAFTAHSVPQSMADSSPYVAQLREACAAIATGAGISEWELVYQSRSGPPSQPWLEPDIGDHIRRLHSEGVRDLIVCPVGFVSDHMEVLYDLDTEAAELCRELGVRMIRASTVGTHPSYIRLIRDMVLEPPMVCAADCCPPPRRVQISSSGQSAAGIGLPGNRSH